MWGAVKNATKEALLNLEVEDKRATVKVHVTSIFPKSKIVLYSANKIWFEVIQDLSPENGFEKIQEIGETLYEDLTVTVTDIHNQVMVKWSPQSLKTREIPKPAKAAKLPHEITRVEELYLTGLHLEQYRHATYDATAYYLEALKREPYDVRCNNAMGLWNLKRARFDKALSYFDKAIETLTEHNPNPYDGEPYFNRGITLKFLGKRDEAYDAFFKSCWNAAWQDAGYFNLALIDCARGNFGKALDLVDRALIKNWHNQKARHLKIILLRKQGRFREAARMIEDTLAIDNFNIGALYERFLLEKNTANLKNLKNLLRDFAHNYIEFSLDYAQAGQFREAINLINLFTDGKQEVYPMIVYFLGWYHEQNGDLNHAKRCYLEAQKMPKDYCFPNRLEEVVVLQSAIRNNPSDAMAPYYLGNFWYASKEYQYARECWESSLKLFDANEICHRNLSLLYYNKTFQKKLARKHLEKAFSLNGADARLLMELDQLYKKENVSVKERLRLLEDKRALTQSRDDLYLEWVSLYNFLGEYNKALNLIKHRRFHPWEGGEGKVPIQYVTLNIELAKQYIKEEKYWEAIKHLKAGQEYPHNLGEGKLFGTQENDINYWLGCSYHDLGEEVLARESWERAAEGPEDPSPAIFYNDVPPDKIFYQGMALLKLGMKEEANKRFKKLLMYGNLHMNDDIKLDYFAISLPDLLIWEEDLNIRNKVNCYYLIGLGNLGLGELDKASAALKKVMELDLYHLPGFIHQKMVFEAASQMKLQQRRNNSVKK